MAKLPTRDDLGPMPSARSGRPIASYDTSAEAKGIQQLGVGMAKVGEAIKTVNEHNDKIAEYDTERKFQQFKWDNDLELEKAGQQMEPGQGGGFAGSFIDGYKTKSKEFLDGVPASLKSKYDLKTFDAERELYGKAAKFGRDEQQRSAITGLDDFSNKNLPNINSPETFEKFRSDYESQIDNNPWLSPIEKDQVRRSKLSNLEMEYGQKTLADRKNARGVLRDLGFGADAEAQPGASGVDVTPISVRLETGQTDPLKGVGSIAKDSKGSHSYGNFGLNSQGSAQAFMRDYGDALGLSGQPGTAAFDNSWKQVARADPQGLHQAEMDWYAKNIAPRIAVDLGHAGVDPAVAADPRVQAYFGDRLVQYGEHSIGMHKTRIWDALEQSGGDAEKFLRALTEADRGSMRQDFPNALRSGVYSEAGHDTRVNGRLNLALATGGGGEAGTGAALPSGPYRNLSNDQRLKLATTARSVLREQAAEVETDIKSFETIAEQGFSPKPGQVDALRARVTEAGDPKAQQNFDQADAVMKWQNTARKWTPQQLDDAILTETERLRNGGATAYDTKRLTMANKLLDTMRTELKQDALGWADRVGLVQVAPIDLTNPEAAQSSMAARVSQATAVANNYGVEPKYLRPDERQRLASILEEGGDQALHSAAAISIASGDKARDVFAEVSKESPAAAIIGGMVAEAGPTSAARDAADGFKLRKQPGFQSAGAPRKDTNKALTDTLGSALSRMPAVQSAVMDTANAIYEIRARKQNLTAFDAATWQQGLREVVGENVVDGKTYGGIVDADPTWPGVRNIVIPPFIAQDGWRDAIGAVQLADLQRASLGTPIARDGTPISLARIKNGTLVQTGPGRYAVSLGDPDVPGMERWAKRQDAPDKLFEIDMYQLRPMLQNRRPELFNEPNRAAPDRASYQMSNPETIAQPILSGTGG